MGSPGAALDRRLRMRSTIRRANRRRDWRSVITLLLTAVMADPARAAALEVEVAGIRGELRRNVLSVLGIAAAARERPSEIEVRRLHRQATGEIQVALQPFGFYRPVIGADLSGGPSRWKARYQIEPGPPIRLDAVEVRVIGAGADDPQFRTRVAEFPLRPGDVLDHTLYLRGKYGLAELAARTGFLDATFVVHEIRLDLERYAAEIALHFDTGPRFRFGEVRFRQSVVDPRLLSGFVTFRRGDPLGSGDLLALQTRLVETPYFARVEVQPRRDLADGVQVPIDVDLVPGKATKYNVGIGYGTDTGPHGRAGMELRRINRKGHRGEAEVRISEIEKLVAGQYLIPWVHGRTDLVTLSAGYEDLRPATSHSRIAQAAVGLIRSRGSRRETYSLSFRRERFDVGGDAGVSLFLIGRAGWSRLRADDRIDPRRGHLLQANGQITDRRVLSDATYARLDGLAKWVRGLWPRGRALARIEAGHVWSPEFRELPPTVRFFAGGGHSVRGYEYHTLGPVDDLGRVTGGESLLTTSVEFEQRVLPAWGLAAFYDAGNAFGSRRDRLRQGVGIGLRWISPVGMVRADAALPANRLDGRVRFHLAIGPDL